MTRSFRKIIPFIFMLVLTLSINVCASALDAEPLDGQNNSELSDETSISEVATNADEENIETSNDCQETIVADDTISVSDNEECEIILDKEDADPALGTEEIADSNDVNVEAPAEEGEASDSEVQEAEDNDVKSGNIKGDAETNSGSSNQGSSTTVSDISLLTLNAGWVQTNTDYGYLSFTFTKGENNVEYEAYITGLVFGTGTSEETLANLAKGIACAYYNNEVFHFANSQAIYDQYQVYINSIDAEKNMTSIGNDNYKKDSNFCWASSSADMIEFTGWDKIAGQDGNEDVIFDKFLDSFTNKPSSQETGLKWYFNGINTLQTVTNEAVKFNSQNSSAQQVSNETFVGYLPEYAGENYIDHYEVSDSGISTLPSVLKELEDGNAVGLGFFFYTGEDRGTRNGGHATTIFGFIKDTVSQAADAIKALFIADSDNCCYAEVTNETGTILAKEQRLNDYTMYIVSPCEKDGMTSLNLINYSTASDTVITDYTVLKNPTNAVKDTEGSHDAFNYADFIINKVVTLDPATGNIKKEFSTSDSVRLAGEIQNVSYTNLKTEYGDNIGDSPRIYYTFKIYNENNELVDTVSEYTVMQNYGYAPLSTIVATTFNLTDSKTDLSGLAAGTYTVYMHIDKITNTDGSVTCKEAYTSNNDCKSCGTFTVVSGATTSASNDENHNGIGDVKSNIDADRTEDLVVPFKFNDGVNSVVLFDTNGNPIEKETTDNYYDVTYDPDTEEYTIIFRTKYLNTLSNGEHEYILNLYDANGKVFSNAVYFSFEVIAHEDYHSTMTYGTVEGKAVINKNTEIYGEHNPVPVYEAVFDSLEGNDLEISFKSLGEEISGYSLMIGDELISSEIYSLIKNADGTYTLVINNEYLSKLFPGTYEFVLHTEAGNIVFKIIVR